MSNSNYEIDLDDDEFSASINQKQQKPTTVQASNASNNHSNNNSYQSHEAHSPKSNTSSRSPSNFHQPNQNNASGVHINSTIPANNNSQFVNNQFGGQFNQLNQNFGSNNNNFNNNYNNFNHYNFTQSFNPSTALLIQTFDWWVNEEDIRGYTVDVNEESSVRTVVFDEHKVNGKSKGVVYIDFNSIESATKVKTHVEQNIKGENQSSLNVTFVSSTLNPFRNFTKNLTHNNNHFNSGNSNNRGRTGNFGPRNNRPNFNNGYYRNNNNGNSNNYNQFQQQFNYQQQYQGFQNNQGYYNQPWPNQQGDGGNPHGQKRPRND